MGATFFLVTCCRALFLAAGLGRVCSILLGAESQLRVHFVQPGEAQSPVPGEEQPQGALGATRLESSLVKKDPGVLVDTTLTMSHQHALGAEGSLCCKRRLREVISLLCPVLVRPLMEFCVW